MSDTELPKRPNREQYKKTIHLIDSATEITDPVAAFIEVACVPQHASHNSGTLEHAEMILARYPEVTSSNIYTAAIVADEGGVREFLSRDKGCAIDKGGPYGWDALTYLCFSRYLRLDKGRSEAFVNTARALLDAGASANTGWYEMIDHPKPRPILESALYGAAAVARHAGVTRLLLERGADPNDEETAYHLPEGYDNTLMKIALESGRFNNASLTCMLVRKADWHDEDGMRMVLEYASDLDSPHALGDNALQHALRRDNALSMIELLLEHGANPVSKNSRDGRSCIEMAARRGRGDVLRLFQQRGLALELRGVDELIAACARGELPSGEPPLVNELIRDGGTLLAEFAGNGNVSGLQCLLKAGVKADALYAGDPYFDVASNSTALHVAAWRGWPLAVKELLTHGTPVNAIDGKGRTALMLAVKACVDSYWTHRRTPDSVKALLAAGALAEGIEIPCGYAAVDELLLRRHE